MFQIVERFDPISDPSDPKMHCVNLILGTEKYVGTGANLKAAKQNAAMQALIHTSYNTRKTMKPRPQNSTATSELYELATKKGLNMDFKFIEPFNFTYHSSMKMWKKDEMRGNYKVLLKVGETLEYVGQAEFPQQAKHDAAIKALPVVRTFPDAVTSTAASGGASATSGDKNAIMLLNEIGMTMGSSIEWTLVSDHGPPHQRQFTWMVKLATFSAQGTGNSKRVAKSAAANTLLELLPEEMKNPGGSKMAKKRKIGSGRDTNPNGQYYIKPAPPNTALVIDGSVITADMCVGKNKEKLQQPQQQQQQQPQQPQPQQQQPQVKPEPKKDPNNVSGKPIYAVIQNPNPISALHEYCKKAKIPEPEFDCVSENVLETWQKAERTFKKIEYTIRLELNGKTYFAAANNKKSAKNKAAEEAWNIIRTGNFP